MMNRRRFAVDMITAAAGLGLRSIGGSRIAQLLSAASATGAVGCSASAPAPLIEADSVPVVSGYSDVVIVGSGYGGAVTAKRLTEKGVSVLMLEMGRLWNTPGSDGKVFCSFKNVDGRSLWFRSDAGIVMKKMFPLDFSAAIPSDAGVLDVIESPDMDVWCGRGVGGGSLVNMGMMVVPPRAVLEEVMPGVDATEMMGTYYPRALAMVKANTVRKGFWDSTSWYQYSRVAYSASQAAGLNAIFLQSAYDYAYMEKEAAGLVPASATSAGEAAFGNNYGKQSVDKNYIADALATGKLVIQSLHIVKSIRQNPDGTYLVIANAIDIQGNLLARKEITCKHLFLCGGSMGTSKLLTRARETGELPNLNGAIGTGWGPNSDLFVFRGNTVFNPTGTNISTVPATGFRTTDQDGKQVFSMDIPFPAGIETFASFNIVMTQNPETGTFRYNPLTDDADLIWNRGQQDAAVRSARYVFDKLNRATGSVYEPNFFRGKDFQDTVTYHPVGGCPLGAATDQYGRVFGYDRLYIADGSLIPHGLTANPALTVAALAERNIERIIAEDFRL